MLALLSFVLTLSNWLWFRRYGSSITARQQRASLGNLTGLLTARLAVLVSVSFLVSLGLMGPIYLYAIFLKDTWGASPFGIGWLLAAFGIAAIIATRPAGSLTAPAPYRPLLWDWRVARWDL